MRQSWKSFIYHLILLTRTQFRSLHDATHRHTITHGHGRTGVCYVPFCCSAHLTVSAEYNSTLNISCMPSVSRGLLVGRSSANCTQQTVLWLFNYSLLEMQSELFSANTPPLLHTGGYCLSSILTFQSIQGQLRE